CSRLGLLLAVHAPDRVRHGLAPRRRNRRAAFHANARAARRADGGERFFQRYAHGELLARLTFVGLVHQPPSPGARASQEISSFNWRIGGAQAVTVST